MDPPNPSTATPPSSIFNVPELVGHVAQYLSRHNIAQCMATCKAWTPFFEPYLWRDIEPRWNYPAPQALALNRHRIRSLGIASYDFANLHTLAADLPNTPFTEPSQEPRDSTSSPTATGNNIFQNLRIIRIDCGFGNIVSDKKSLCLDYILRILNQSPGLLQLSSSYDILGDSFTSNQTQSFLYALAHKLPCLKKLNIHGDGERELQGETVRPEIALEFLRVCLSHPQLANLHCDFVVDYFTTEEFDQYNAFSNPMEDDKNAGTPAQGSTIKSLYPPVTADGYPPNFLYTLLRSCLPNLELFYIPEVNGDIDPSSVDSLRDAVAQGCPKLRHLRCSWYEEGLMDRVINGIVKGCKQWGLKSFHCEGLDDQYRILGTLNENHCETLEDVELTECRHVESDDLVDLFSCRNLKQVKIQQKYGGRSAVELQNVKFKCHDLKELQLTMVQPDMNPVTDAFGEEEEGHEDILYGKRLERFRRWIRCKAEEAYTEIGSLSKLESLSVGCGEKDYRAVIALSHKRDLTLEHGWLQKLAGLKELKRLRMATNFWSEMGQAEVEFMDAQWPKLERIVFYSLDTKAIVEKPHWQWLKKRRPKLAYFCYYFTT
ncbi:hypothetical protein BGX34_007666 [Mortierella sp. NVP85]|nr:hypothetical protein BGX34_007666 [Mortierella sp. NVP85]